MRHGKKINHLGRTAPHRKAMLANMACSLIEHKRINTTVAKAKALRTYVEPLLTKSKEDSTHNRRTVFAYLKNKFAVAELFRDISPKIAERNGGYTRIIKTGFRSGDGADMAMIELVDYNTIYNAKEEKKTSRRSRRGGAKSTDKNTVGEATTLENTPSGQVSTQEDALDNETDIESTSTSSNSNNESLNGDGTTLSESKVNKDDSETN